MRKDENNIPRCQKIQNEYKAGLTNLRETIAEIKMGNPIPIETFVNCMSFVYREGWTFKRDRILCDECS